MNSKNVKPILKTEIKVIAYVIICLTIIVLGISYSLYSDVKRNSANQVVKAGNLTFNFEHGTQITSATGDECFNQTNETDAQSLTKCACTVTVKNNGTLPGTYSLNLKSTATNNALDLSKLKVILKKDGKIVSGYPKTVSSLGSNALISNTLAVGATEQYSIQVFVDESITENDNEKEISFNIEGVAEVNANNNINPT